MKVNFEIIYEHVGYLFFALTQQKKKLSSEELMRLHRLVDTYWRQTPNGDITLYIHLTDCIHAGIKHATTEAWSSEAARHSFENYYKLHAMPFGTALKEKIFTFISILNKEFPGNEQYIQKTLQHLKDVMIFKPVL